MRIIHIGPDSQFIQYLSGVFEAAAPGASRYLITGASSTGRLRFPVHGGAVSISVPGKLGAASIPLHVGSCDMIIAHGMGPHSVAAFLSSPRKTVRVWSGWGFDYYGDDRDPTAGLVSPGTSALMTDEALPSARHSGLKKAARQMLAYATRKAAKRTDYFSAPIPSDFDIFKRRFENFSGAYAQLNYGSVVDTFAQGLTMGRGLNILVGNSASQTNNHIDIFHMLAKHDLGSRKVIVPLSYGDRDYRRNLIACGSDILGHAFMPLVDFLPLDQYCSIVGSCNVVVMNQLRQQALGNIGAALYQGAHVFLDPISPVYRFFRQKGAFVRSTHDLALYPLPVTGLPNDQIAKNRDVLEGFWGNERIRANVEALLAKVTSA